MKIQPTSNKDIIKTLCFFWATVVPTSYLTYKCEDNLTKRIQKEVLLKDSSRYKRVEKEFAKYDYVQKKNMWARELADINDSLRIDSIAKKAYFEGAQRVRDSINNSKK